MHAIEMDSMETKIKISKDKRKIEYLEKKKKNTKNHLRNKEQKALETKDSLKATIQRMRKKYR